MMKRLSAYLIALLLLGASSLYAQEDSLSRENNAPIAKPRKERVPLKDKLVFGGSMGLQFGTFTNINLSPILGYKVTKNWIPCCNWFRGLKTRR